MKPKEIVDQIEMNPALPAGEGDRFAGYAVMGLPFRSGHVLALRRFMASSVGPGYTSVWHRDPSGIWTFYSTVYPELGCARYFGGEIAHNIVVPIEIEWTGPTQFTVQAGTSVHWEVALAESLSTCLMSAAAGLVPDSWWQRKSVLNAMGAAARLALGTGKVNFTGKTPNGHKFIANPQRVWLIDSSRAVVKGQDLGPVGPLSRQAELRDLLIPQKGLFAVARAFLEAPSQASGALPGWGGLMAGDIKL
ncbi:MAG TPA: hypothetical protein VH601_09850 [Bryobacteraceae bacterium]|jgi:hypothetical protein